MSERVLHEWTDSESIIRIVEDDRGFFGWSAESGIVTDLIPTVFCRELARLAARVSELEKQNAKLRKCVKAGDHYINSIYSITSNTGLLHAEWDEKIDYYAARAEVDNG